MRAAPARNHGDNTFTGRPFRSSDLVDPSEARSAYKESFGAHQNLVQQALEERGVKHLIAPTNKPLDFVLIDLLRSQPLSGRVAQ